MRCTYFDNDLFILLGQKVTFLLVAQNISVIAQKKIGTTQCDISYRHCVTPAVSVSSVVSLRPVLWLLYCRWKRIRQTHNQRLHEGQVDKEQKCQMLFRTAVATIIFLSGHIHLFYKKTNCQSGNEVFWSLIEFSAEFRYWYWRRRCLVVCILINHH